MAEERYSSAVVRRDDHGGMITIVNGDGRRVMRLPLRGGRIRRDEDDEPGKPKKPGKPKEKARCHHHVKPKDRPGLKGGHG